MDRAALTTIATHFGAVPDPRMDRNKAHQLVDMLTIAVCAVVCGADTRVDIELFGNAKLAWFRTFLALPNGIPSHDTFGRVCARIDPRRFQDCFLAWVQDTVALSGHQVIAVDGKTVRGSQDRIHGRGPRHMVSAWATENHVILGQLDVEAKSNEITAIPLLLDALDIAGHTVTIDAMGCQKEIAERIAAGGGEYLLAVKENQGRLYDDIIMTFAQVPHAHTPAVTIAETRDEGHGRVELRRVVSTDDLELLRTRADWPQLQRIVMVESTRITDTGTTTAWRYYISSQSTDAAALGTAIRAHWQIENQLHWVLDIAFDEDRCRVRKDHAAKNLVVLRHITANLLRQETSTKMSIRSKRLRAGWDDAYLLKLLTASTSDTPFA